MYAGGSLPSFESIASRPDRCINLERKLAKERLLLFNIPKACET